MGEEELFKTPDGLAFRLSDVTKWFENKSGTVRVGRIGNFAVISTLLDGAWRHQVCTKEMYDRLLKFAKSGEEISE